MALAPSPKLKKKRKNWAPGGLSPWILSFGSWVIKRTETQNKMAPTVGIPGLGMGKSPRPLKLENKMAPDVAFVRIGVVSDNGGMAYMSKQA